ncbi:glycosyl transferase [Marinobacterium nitratireducens]|uniref:Glycosyl transferase n=1 Tax=Marinobacterium nitratireducens TaxID=518897 RepID=A0A917ZDJ0_9GAMM|nr:glycosyltransferase [Marinobacterium nitratireducens]GGO81081.1 glycosyl transferase [Marinobacterium nitratireducens]
MSDGRGTARILFYVQHLLGIGHLRRAALISDALVARGFEVHLALGGEPVPAIPFNGARCHYLPAVKTDAAFSGLTDAAGEPIDDAFRQLRCERLLALANDVQPAAIITELYPFGRRQMRFELRPLLQWAERQPKRPLLICSLRDILQRRRAEREQETLALVQHHYDRIWVHGDSRLSPLAASFGPAAAIAERTFYTGYVAPAAPCMRARSGVVVSAGGGAVGRQLLHAALDAHRAGLLDDRPWTLIAGPGLPEADYARLGAEAERPGMELIRFCERFIERLAGAELSISQAGYNTVMDLIVSGVPAVLVPFAGDGETEQLERARALEAGGRASLVTEANLDAASLAQAAQRALGQSHSLPPLPLEGAACAAEDLALLLRQPGGLA